MLLGRSLLNFVQLLTPNPHRANFFRKRLKWSWWWNGKTPIRPADRGAIFGVRRRIMKVQVLLITTKEDQRNYLLKFQYIFAHNFQRKKKKKQIHTKLNHDTCVLVDRGRSGGESEESCCSRKKVARVLKEWSR